MKIIFLPFLFIASTAEAGTFEHASGVVGLYYLPCAEESVKIYSKPDSKQAIGKLYYANRERTPEGEFICSKPTVHIEGGGSGLSERHGELPLIYLKDGDGAVVLNYKNGWIELKLDKGTAWVNDPGGQSNQSVDALIHGSMNYVRIVKPVPVQETPGKFSSKKPLKVSYQPQLDVKVLEFRNINGKLWIKIESDLIDCGGLDENSIKRFKQQKPVSGWLPFHDDDGQPTVWFYSGGC